MKTRLWVIAVLLATIALAGCSSMQGFPERSAEVEKRLTSLQNNYFLPAKDVLYEYDQLRPNKDDMKDFRDDVILGRMMAYDLQFSVFREKIYEEGVGTNLVVDILGVGVGAAGAAFTGATSSRIMSALSGGIAGTGTAINENLYFEKTMPALMALMEAEREKIKVTIYQGMTLGVDDYPLGKGMVDLERYYFAGSIPGAIASVTKAAGVEKDKAEKDLKQLTTGKFSKTQATNLLRAYWKPDGTNINAENAQRLLGWMDSQGFDTGPGAITMFLYSDWAENARIEAATALNLMPQEQQGDQ